MNKLAVGGMILATFAFIISNPYILVLLIPLLTLGMVVVGFQVAGVARKPQYVATRGMRPRYGGRGQNWPTVHQRVPRPHIPDAVKAFVWKRDGGRCRECGSDTNMEFDHIIPLALGGSNTVKNIQLLCATCNRRKGARLTVRRSGDADLTDDLIGAGVI